MDRLSEGIGQKVASFLEQWLGAGDPGFDSFHGVLTNPLTVVRVKDDGETLATYSVKDLATGKLLATFGDRSAACAYVASRLCMTGADPGVEFEGGRGQPTRLHLDGREAASFDEVVDPPFREGLEILLRLASHGDALAWAIQAAGPHTLARAFEVVMGQEDLLNDVP